MANCINDVLIVMEVERLDSGVGVPANGGGNGLVVYECG